MIKRIIFTFGQAIKQAKLLRVFKTQHIASISAIDLSQWPNDTVKAVVLDFDGVLAAHGSAIPNLPAQEFLTRLYSKLPSGIFILSNKPTDERKRYFQAHFPGIQFVRSERKKPYPDGLIKIAKIAGVTSSNIILLDDRLLTGGLAAVLAGCQFLYISRPFIRLGKHCLSEIFFQSLRIIERFIF